MTTIVFFGTPGHGHINPTLPVVRGLRGRGIRVLYYNHEFFRAKIEASGAEFVPYPDGVPGPESIGGMIDKNLVALLVLLFEGAVRMCDFCIAELERIRPDIVVIDGICLWGAVAARVTGIPVVASHTTFIFEKARLPLRLADVGHFAAGGLRFGPRILGARRKLVRRYGKEMVPPGLIFPFKADFNIAYTIRELQPPTSFIDDSFRFVGPSIARNPDSGDLPDTGGLPVVYVALGTIFNRDRSFFETCFEAFKDVPAVFFVSTGPHEFVAPRNFVLRNNWDQCAVLSKTRLFISHAGTNSIQESLYFGVPMLMIPRQVEQALNARIAAALGVGLILDDKPPYGRRVRVNQLREGFDRMFADPSFGASAQRVSALMQATPGSEGAVSLIETFIAASAASKRIS